MKTIALFAVLISMVSAQPLWAKDESVPARADISVKGLDEMGYPTNTASAFAKGEADARRDWSNGVFTVKTAGLPAPTRQFYEARLKERCGVTLDPLAGCLVTEGLMKYIEGYNKFSDQQIEQKFGTNIFSELDVQAEADYKKSLRKPIVSDVSERQYMISSGDTLLKIARENGVTLKALSAANPGLDPKKLKPGDVIQVPARTIPPSAIKRAN